MGALLPRQGSAVHRLTFVPPRSILIPSSYTRPRGLIDIRRHCSRACGIWKTLFLPAAQLHSCLPSYKILSSRPLCLLRRHLLRTCLLRNTRISLPLPVLVVTKWWLAMNLLPTSLLATFGGSMMRRRRTLLASLCPITSTSLGAGRIVKKFCVASLLDVSQLFFHSALAHVWRSVQLSPSTM